MDWKHSFVDTGSLPLGGHELVLERESHPWETVDGSGSYYVS